MASGRRDSGPGGRGGKKTKGRRRLFQKRKVCRFCADSKMTIDYKGVKTLRYFTTERGKVIPRRISGNCAQHQRKLSVAIHRARMIALLPFTSAHS